MNVFVLIGCKDYDSDQDILGIYSNLNYVLEDIHNYEQNKLNYACLKCDFGLIEEEISERQFRERKCPECGEILCFTSKDYMVFEIKKVRILSGPIYKKKLYKPYADGKVIYCYKDEGNFYGDEEEIYRCKYNWESKAIEQWYLGKKKESRSENDPIKINNFTRNIVSCDKNE